MKEEKYHNIATEFYQIRVYNLFNYGLAPQNCSNVNEAVKCIERCFQHNNAGFLLSHGIIYERLSPSSKWNICGIIINEIAEKQKKSGGEWQICYYNKKDEICRMEPCEEPLTQEALQQSIQENEVYAVLSYRKTWEDEPDISDEWMTTKVAIRSDMETATLIKTSI